MMARLLVFALLLVSVGCDRLPGKPTPSDIALLPGQIRDFPTLYQQNCAGCHGHNGRGNGAIALATPVYLAIVSDDTLRGVTARGVPGTLMPAFAKSAGGALTDEQIDILVQGMRTRWTEPDALHGATPPPYAASSPGDARHGAEDYSTFCASCHGADGKGTTKGSSIVDVSFLELVSDQYLRTTILAGRPELGQPDWRNCVTNQPMTAEQISDIVAWLASRRSLTSGQPNARGQ